jgi:MYXO-CTERM domain-containing protein
VYRTDVDVDISESGSGYAIGWMTAGEWLEYTVDVAVEGDYTLVLNAGAVDPGRTVEVEVCGVPIAAVDIPQISDWGEIATSAAYPVVLPAGLTVVRVTVGANDYLDLDSITLELVDSGTGGSSGTGGADGSGGAPAGGNSGEGTGGTIVGSGGTVVSGSGGTVVSGSGGTVVSGSGGTVVVGTGGIGAPDGSGGDESVGGVLGGGGIAPSGPTAILDGDETSGEEPGCGCRTVGKRGGSTPSGSAAALALLALCARRRRRIRSASRCRRHHVESV